MCCPNLYSICIVIAMQCSISVTQFLLLETNSFNHAVYDLGTSVLAFQSSEYLHLILIERSHQK